MALSDAEKTASSFEQQENEKLGLKAEAGFVELAEEVHYGYAGARAFLTSPYVFRAALLASMGGFSYGYGVYPSKQL